MITIKIIFLLILAVTPFLIESMVRAQKNDYKGFQKRVNSLIQKITPHLYVLSRAVVNFFFVLHDKMKKSEYARDFFVKICLIIMITYLFVDFAAAGAASSIIADKQMEGAEHEESMQQYGFWIPVQLANIFAHMAAIGFFFHSYADKVLTALHNSKEKYFLLAMITLCFLLPELHCMPIAMILYIYLIAAYIYPNKINNTDGASKKIPEQENNNKIYFNKAA